jgi:hypothetical protein
VTELDAHTIASNDATQDTPRLQAAKTPSELSDAIFRRMLFRIRRLNDGEAHEAAFTAYGAPDPNPPQHFSLVLASTAIRIIEAAEPRLHPEDMRALLLWTSGSQEGGPGYIQHMIHQLPDTATQMALQQLGQFTANTYQQLDHRDRHMFTNMIGTLPSSSARAIRGLLMEAKWCNADGDGESARLKIIRARELATRLIKHKMRSDKFFYGAA